MRKCFDFWQKMKGEWPGFLVGVKTGKYLQFWGDDAEKVHRALGGGQLPKVGGVYFLSIAWKDAEAIATVQGEFQGRLVEVAL